MEMHFCRRCGLALQKQTATSLQCDNKHTIFLNPIPSVGVFIIDKTMPLLTVTLAVRGIEPRKGMLDSFGGFVDVEESFEDAVYRELREELGIEKHEYTKPVYLRSAVGHYPYEAETLPVVCNFYWIELLGTTKLVVGDDVEAAVTVPLCEVELSKLHDDDVRAGIIELQKQLEASK